MPTGVAAFDKNYIQYDLKTEVLHYKFRYTTNSIIQ